MHVVTISLALTLLASAPAAPATVCTNGSFEELAPNGFPADWGAVGRTVEVSSDAHSGERSLRFLRTKETETSETGLNRGPLIDRLKGGVDFWYKAVSARSTMLNIQVIPMNAEPREGTGAPRATFTVPEEHIGDGRWHHARLKYDFTAIAEVKSVHFAVRIVGSEGELLLDDVSYVEQVGKLLQFGKIAIEEDKDKPGERCTVRARIENMGDTPAPAVRAKMIVHPDRGVPASEITVGDLGPDEQRWISWIHEGERTAGSRLEFVAITGDEETRTWLTLTPKLVLRSFGPTTPVVAQKAPVMLVCLLENTGTASVVNPRVVYTVPGGLERCTAERLHPGQTRAFSTCIALDQQVEGVPISVRIGAGNIDGEQTARTTLVVGSAARPGKHSGELKALATDQIAILENEHVRLVFRHNDFGIGPGELFVVPDFGSPKTVAWLPRLARLVLDGPDGSRREHVVLSGVPPTVQNGGRATLEFAWSTPEGEEPACRVRARFSLGKGEKDISTDYELTCSSPCKLRAFDGPMLYARQRDEAVFPGLEWLVDDEVSSSTLDIAEGHPHQVRRVVHPDMVTIPAVGIHGTQGTVGLVWDLHQKWDGRRDRPSVVFASPDRFENQRSHLVGLFLPSVPESVEVNEREAATPYPLEPGKPLRLTARIFADSEATDAVAAVDEWIRLYGIPEPAPLPHGSYDREIEFSMQAYLDSLWESETKDWWTTKGGGMMSTRGRPPSFVADLLLGAAVSPNDHVRLACKARAAEVLALIGGDARVDAQRFRGRADLAMANPAQAASFLASRGEDGAWRFDADQKHTTGPFVGMDYHELGPDNAIELGTCARNAFEVLGYARIAGDPAAYETMQKTLVLMESFRVPRAAQVWEVPVHTPDVLAAADAVDAYVEAYRFSGDERWLRDAVTWARRGLPFIYLWNDPDKPFLVGASIPVFGATWYQGSWFGCPVQWNGLRYANALLKLDEHDQSLPWRKLAEAIIRSAIHQQDLDGENVALWPDNISAIDSKKCPWVFAPRQIIQNVLKLTGRDEDPSTVILGEGDQRLHISATAKISEATWEKGELAFCADYPAGEQGVVLISNVTQPASVFLNGRPIAAREEIESGPQPGWRYDEANAYLAIRVTRDGASTIEIEGAEFRSVSRLPVPVKRIAFEFDDSAAGWVPAHDVAGLRVAAGVLSGKITGPDPYVVRMLVDVAGDQCPVIRLRMRVTAGQGGQFFWTTEASLGFAEDKTVRFAMQADGQFREYRLEPGHDPNWAGQKITALRIDPGNGANSGEFAIDYVRGDVE
jgi:hypothetical protein